jgi:hypothetical protein
MTKSLWARCLIAVGLLALPGLTLAHHGTAVYDANKYVKVQGTVTRFEFTNPHAILAVAAKGANGTVVEWEGEMTSPNNLVRAGWSSRTFKSGDQVTMEGLGAKSGASLIWIKKLTRADGRVLPLGVGEEN